MDNRFILCQEDSGLLASKGMNLLTLVKLLARAIVHHLPKHLAVVIDPANSFGSTLFFPDGTSVDVSPNNPPSIADVLSNTAANWGNAGATTVHYLVVHNASDSSLCTFMNNVQASFDVVTRVIDYANRFAPLNPAPTPWLVSNGAAMPAILLPSSSKGHAGPMKTFVIDAGLDPSNPLPTPPERDGCRMRLDKDEVNADALKPDWSTVKTRAQFERWARTIAWRRVGICVSGGGASTFRLAKLFEQIEAAGLPIDLLAGVSGGTLFSACYAFGGMKAVKSFAYKRGKAFTTRIVGALAWSGFVERFIDDYLDNCGVCNTEIRVVPLSMQIAPSDEPKASVIVDGTFGQAGRASGGAPFFAPYKRGNVRQGDGAILAGVPPSFLAERFGADMIFAMNVLALPTTRFPGEDAPIWGAILKPIYDYTPLGRMADAWGATATMLHTIAEGGLWLADDFYDAPPYNWAAVEQPMFWNAKHYFDDGPVDANLTELTLTAQDWYKRWSEM